MKPVIQKIPLPANSSFITMEVDNSWIGMNWHQHEEIELILFTGGSGSLHTEEKEIPFTVGDIFFLGSKLTHKYQVYNSGMARATAIQFRPDLFGNTLLNIPEFKQINNLINKVSFGLHITEKTTARISNEILSLTKAEKAEKVILLLQCLHKISNMHEGYITFGSPKHNLYSVKNELIDKTIRFTKNNFQSPIKLHQVASLACMSIASFCNFFKQCTHTTYIDYLNEVRIDHACRQLRETNKSIADIGYESGYNTIAHFHRQFVKLIKSTPLQYRRVNRLSSYTINLKAI